MKEWAIPNGLYHAAATAIRMPSSDLVVVHMQRHLDAHAFAPADLALLDRFRPHLARAGVLAVRLQFERLHAATQALELIGLPALILNRSGRVICANTLAQALHAHLLWLPQDTFALLDPRADKQLRNALLLGQNGPPVACSFPSSSRTDGDRAVMHLIPVTRTLRDFFEGGFSILVISPIGQESRIDRTIIACLFDLTPAEADIAAHIANGLTLSAISRIRRSSLGTLRSQLKAIFEKTGTNRQHELASLLSGIPRMP